MKELLTEALNRKLAATLESLGGARALYGDPIRFGGEEIVPVARILVSLSAGAEGSGGGNAGLTGAVSNLARGGGGGNAEAGIRVSIEPVGYLRAGPDGPVFCALAAGPG